MDAFPLAPYVHTSCVHSVLFCYQYSETHGIWELSIVATSHVNVRYIRKCKLINVGNAESILDNLVTLMTKYAGRRMLMLYI